MSEASAGRLFVGIPFPQELREGLLEHLRATFGERLPGRAVVPANWHLTLRFLGDTGPGRLRSLADQLRHVDGGARFDLSLAALGAFPRPARASVLWIGVGEGEAEVRALAAKVEAAAVRAGFAAEPRPYSPHLTLSRLMPPADLRRAIAAAPAYGGRMTVDGFVLFRSHLGGGPPRYERVEHFPLA
jgi:2'-5' RNA ligase